MGNGKVGVGIIGCGNIAGPYARSMKQFGNLHLVGAADLDPGRAERFAAEHGGRAYGSLEALLEDGAVDLALNLTIHHAHREVVARCLEAGKPVYSEKPLAMSSQEAGELVELAERQGLRLGCSPITFLGEAQQTAGRWLREAPFGPPRVVYVEVNHGRIESWHPAPGPFYAVGPMFDVGVYPLTLLTAFLGPARRVSAFGKVVKPDRLTKSGEPFTVETPDFLVALVELASGPLVRLTANFYVGSHNKQGSGIEFHADGGSLHLSSWFHFDAPLEAAPYGQGYEPLPLAREPASGLEWALGVSEMAGAMLEGRPHRATGAQAAHIVEVLEAVHRSARTGEPVELRSSFTPPAPMEWARERPGAGIIRR